MENVDAHGSLIHNHVMIMIMNMRVGQGDLQSVGNSHQKENALAPKMRVESENAYGTVHGVEFRVCLGGMPIDGDQIIKYTLAETGLKNGKQTYEKLRNENQKPQKKDHEIQSAGNSHQKGNALALKMRVESENACGTARGVEFRVCLGGMPIDGEHSASNDQICPGRDRNEEWEADLREIAKWESKAAKQRPRNPERPSQNPERPSRNPEKQPQKTKQPSRHKDNDAPYYTEALRKIREEAKRILSELIGTLETMLESDDVQNISAAVQKHWDSAKKKLTELRRWELQAMKKIAQLEKGRR